MFANCNCKVPDLILPFKFFDLVSIRQRRCTGPSSKKAKNSTEKAVQM